VYRDVPIVKIDMSLAAAPFLSQMEFLKRTQRNILEFFQEDPKTIMLKEKHYASIHRAVLVKRGQVIAAASNNYGSRSRGSGYSRSSIHAEKNVVKVLGNVHKLQGADMYIMRFSRCSEMKFVKSTPCPACKIFLEKCIREYGLKNVYYIE
jgi:deoxycytidylate deaminase